MSYAHLLTCVPTRLPASEVFRVQQYTWPCIKRQLCALADINPNSQATYGFGGQDRQFFRTQEYTWASTKRQKRSLADISSNSQATYGFGGQQQFLSTCLSTRRFCDAEYALEFHAEVPLSPPYLIESLALALLHSGELNSNSTAAEVASQLLDELSLVVAELVSISFEVPCAQLEGLMDLSRPGPSENLRRAARRRLHQALRTLVHNFVLDPKLHLKGVADTIAEGNAGLRKFAKYVIEEKHRRRELCKLGVPFSTVPPREQWSFDTCGKSVDASIYQPPRHASSEAAGVHKLKQWSRNVHEWCAEIGQYYFLQDPTVRIRWITGGRTARSRVTLLTQELRRISMEHRSLYASRLSNSDWQLIVQRTAEVALPVAGSRLRLLDVGSCSNFFGIEQSDRFDVTAVDLLPGHPSVLTCDFLKLAVGEEGSAAQSVIDPDSGTTTLTQLPSGHFDVAIVSLLLSVLPGPMARQAVVSKVRQLLRNKEGYGLLIIADTAGTVGRHIDLDSRRSKWVHAVESAGFKLAPDPQMHLSRLREKKRGGFANRAFCWSFLTASSTAGATSPIVPFIWETLGVQAARQSARKQRKELLTAARNGSVRARRQLRGLCVFGRS